MTTALAILSAVLQIIPALIAAVKAIEEAIPGQGKGEAKVAAVREIVTVVNAEAVTLWPILEKVVGILVTTFNKTGVFVKTPTE